MSEKDPGSGKESLDPNRTADKAWYLRLLDEEAQQSDEEEHLAAVLSVLKRVHLLRYRKRLAEIEAETAELKSRENFSAQDYRDVLECNARAEAVRRKLDSYKCFFREPYFARMDVTDDKEGYNVYYIGKKGDPDLEIVDWRAPLAVRYYQKSRVDFRINEYEYRTVLRRALSVKNGKFLGFRNEYLSVKDVLTPEEIAGRDEEILFDPYLRNIIGERKDDVRIRDIIRTIQEKQFAIITRPERESFVLQGCAGSGKTMILLHRLSYLMYNNEALRPRDVLVITPSDSFNAFIDELSQVLELEKVRTITLKNYYLRVLKNEGIELSFAEGGEREDTAYLTYLYSEEFPRDVVRDLGRLYGDVYGMFAGRECREVAEQVLDDCRRRREKYALLKNASVRIRRAVLGEMKEREDGGFYFTKPLRGVMSCFVQVEDFLNFVLGEDTRSCDYFFRQYVEFYRAAREICAHGAAALENARRDLASLNTTVGKEIADLMRYRRKIGGEEILTYADRIGRRKELLAETERVEDAIEAMRDGLPLFCEFFAVLRQSWTCADAGKCAGAVDLARFYYRRTVKKYKAKYGMKGTYPSDGYAICAVLAAAGRQLTPRYGLVFVDEGQDVSASEYALLKKIHTDAAFNVFGDLRQNITPWRGIPDWSSFETVYELRRNYRNTNEIVEFVSGETGVEMAPIGLHGEEVTVVRPRRVSAFFRGKQGLKAVIAREEYLPLFEKRGYARLSLTDRISKSKINVMTVYESKGLEFSAVAVYDRGMTENEKYIAYTRALRDLVLVRD